MDGITDQKRWLDRYQAASEALARIRALELAAMSEQEARRRIESLVVADTPWRERPDWSGLVEQQAAFHRRRTA